MWKEQNEKKALRLVFEYCCKRNFVKVADYLMQNYSSVLDTQLNDDRICFLAIQQMPTESNLDAYFELLRVYGRIMKSLSLIKGHDEVYAAGEKLAVFCADKLLLLLVEQYPKLKKENQATLVDKYFSNDSPLSFLGYEYMKILTSKFYACYSMRKKQFFHYIKGEISALGDKVLRNQNLFCSEVLSFSKLGQEFFFGCATIETSQSKYLEKHEWNSLKRKTYHLMYEQGCLDRGLAFVQKIRSVKSRLETLELDGGSQDKITNLTLQSYAKPSESVLNEEWSCIFKLKPVLKESNQNISKEQENSASTIGDYDDENTLADKKSVEILVSHKNNKTGSKGTSSDPRNTLTKMEAMEYSIDKVLEKYQAKKKQRKRIRWTIEEEEAIIEEVVNQGNFGKWKEILEKHSEVFHPRRTPTGIKDKWRNLKKHLED